MNTYYIIFILFFYFIQIYARPTQTIQINSNSISYINKPNDGSGNYYFAYKSEDGTIREEKGEFRNGTMRVIGNYSYKSPDGALIEVYYEADENGYRVIPVSSTDDRFNIPESPVDIDPTVLCSLLGRCAEETEKDSFNSDAQI